MKFFNLMSVVLILIFCGAINSSQTTSEIEKGKTETAEGTPIDGAWVLVWAKYNDTVVDVQKIPLFKMFHNGVFSLIARDSAKHISFAGFGTYQLDGKMYKETFLYHNNPELTGGSDWQEYELKGDTLYFKGFNKVIIGGKELTSGFPRIEEKRVRMK